MPPRRFQMALLAGVVVGLLAEVSINPFGTAFRFSLGPVALAFFALFFTLPAYLTGMAAGLIVPLVHGLVNLAQQPTLSMMETFWSVHRYVPETLAYSLLGFFLFLFRVQERTRQPLQLALYLALSDFMANAIEFTVRGEPLHPRPFLIMALVALGRAAVSEGAYYILQEGVRERQWAEERQSYMQKLLFLSNLQTEAFFLQKSAREIEQIMARAHKLYRNLAGHPGQQAALEIAKDIHEVKKDYQRTLHALFRMVEVPQLQPEMSFSEIVNLVLDANETYARTLGKEIHFHALLDEDFRTPRFGRWVSILNNLVSNSVEACDAEGSVTIISERTEDRFILRIADTGAGIPTEDWDLIFSAGFSTKLNPTTGSFSSGIGLTHVTGLVRWMNGTIRVESSRPGHTVFLVTVPWESLEEVTQEG